MQEMKQMTIDAMKLTREATQVAEDKQEDMSASSRRSHNQFTQRES